MRDAFIKTLELIAKKDRNIFLLNGDIGFSVLENFARLYPGRSINMGVAEANMIGVASGLALSGKTVFVYSIIPFVTARVFEQVRNDVTLQNANVKIVGVGAGLSYGQLGPTHHAVEDIALMRVLPGMTVLCPGDPYEACLATKAAARIKGPVYLRIGKRGEPNVHATTPVFRVGKAIVVKKGGDCTLIATGNMLSTALEVSAILENKGRSVRVISMHTIKPFDSAAVIKAARDTNAVFTLEEHSVIGGLGSAVSEALLESNVRPRVFYRFGIRDCATLKSGSQNYLQGLHGLQPRQIARRIAQILERI